MNVICLNTDERNEETRQLFEQIKPLLDEGYSYRSAVLKVKGINHKKYPVSHLSWYKALVEYGDSHGYPKRVYIENRWRRKK